MIRAFVVDDERLAVQRLTRLLEAGKRVEVVGSTTDPEKAIEFLGANAVDVLFLDIQMPGLTGFALLERLERSPFVVFTTAYDRYALDAFAVNSIDYLLKPIDPERLARALDKLERLSGTGTGTVQGDLSPARDVRALARQLAAELSPGKRLERVASRVGERTTVLEATRITHFFSKDKLTFAVTNGREHAIDLTLADLEARLDPRRFVRIHRATIVNVSFVQELYPGVDARRQTQNGGGESKGGMLVRLKDERKTELSVARDRVRDLKSRLGI